jgi:hypothetical protein
MLILFSSYLGKNAFLFLFSKLKNTQHNGQKEKEEKDNHDIKKPLHRKLNIDQHESHLKPG